MLHRERECVTDEKSKPSGCVVRYRAHIPQRPVPYLDTLESAETGVLLLCLVFQIESVRRRAFLFVAGSTGIAGCTGGFRERLDPVRLGVVEFTNTTESDQTLEVAVFANDALEYETTVTLGGATPDGSTNERLARNWQKEANSYRIDVDSDLEARTTTLRFDESFAETCETVLIVLRPQGIETYRGAEGRCYE